MAGFMDTMKRRLSLFVERMKDRESGEESDSDFTDSEDERGGSRRRKQQKQINTKPHHTSLNKLDMTTVDVQPTIPFGHAGLRAGPGGQQAVRKLSIREFLVAKTKSSTQQQHDLNYSMLQRDLERQATLPGQLADVMDPVSPIQYQRRSSVCLTK